MKFELVILNLKVVNRGVRLIFTTLMCEITISPLLTTTSILAPIIYSEVLNAYITLLKKDYDLITPNN